LLLAPTSLLLFGLYAGVRAWCVRQARFGAVSRGQIARSLAGAAAWIGLGVAGALKAPGLALTAGQTIADAVFCAWLFRGLGRRDRRVVLTPRLARMRAALARNKEMVGALVSSQALAALYGRLPVIVIAAAFGPVQAGYYAFAERIVGAPSTLIANSIGDVYRQRAADAHRAGKPFDRLMRGVLKTTLAISVVPFAIAIAATPFVFGPIFGEAWAPAASTVMIIGAGALIAFNATPVDKAPTIVGARGYILSWHSARFAAEGAAAVAALCGWVDYPFYLVGVVSIRVGLYAWDVVVCHGLAARGKRDG
jgi:O-antigen/teichoic acid export membrane protein